MPIAANDGKAQTLADAAKRANGGFGEDAA